MGSNENLIPEIQNTSETPKETESTVTQKDLKEFQTQVDARLNALEKPKDETENSFDSLAGYISIAAVFLSLIAVIIAFLVKSKVSNQIDGLTKKLNGRDGKVEELSKKISQLENEVADLKKEIHFQQRMTENNLTAPMPSEKIVLNKFPPPEKKVVQPAPPPKEKWFNFVQDFNSLSAQSGYDAKKASEEFLKNYSIQAFSCKNFEARVDLSSTEPQFGTTSPQSADFWAYEFESGIFAVVPKAKNYTDNHHTARAMGEVFQSNFKRGGTYNKIRVEKPAIFKGMWNLEKQGILELS